MSSVTSQDENVIMYDEKSKKIIKIIATRIEQKVKAGQLVLETKSLDKLSERVVYDVICELRDQKLIDHCEDVIYDEKSHQFPDIVIKFNKEYQLGVEVKSSSSVNNSWAINGNSVLGSTSIDVNDVYIIFIKYNLKNGFDIRYARYEDSITDVVVTHSPRYKIDLNIHPKESFFNKSGISYEEIKASENPIALITNYFRSEGKTAWWLGDNNNESSSSATILSWSDIDIHLISHIYGQAFVLFPEIINGPVRHKYSRLAKWLVAKYSIADASLRDRFSAGGRAKLTYKKNDEKIIIEDAAKVYERLTEHKAHINNAFRDLVLSELQEFWSGYRPNTDSIESRKEFWFSLYKKNEKSDELLNYVAYLFEINIP